jgi:hypothetical protein
VPQRILFCVCRLFSLLILKSWIHAQQLSAYSDWKAANAKDLK